MKKKKICFQECAGAAQVGRQSGGGFAKIFVFIADNINNNNKAEVI